MRAPQAEQERHKQKRGQGEGEEERRRGYPPHDADLPFASGKLLALAVQRVEADGPRVLVHGDAERDEVRLFVLVRALGIERHNCVAEAGALGLLNVEGRLAHEALCFARPLHLDGRMRDLLDADPLGDVDVAPGRIVERLLVGEVVELILEERPQVQIRAAVDVQDGRRGDR